MSQPAPAATRFRLLPFVRRVAEAERLRDVVAAAGPVPLVGADRADDAAVRVLADDQDVAVDVLAGEVAAADADVVLEEPEADLGRAVVVEAVGAEVDPGVAADLVDGRVGVEELVLVRDAVVGDGPVGMSFSSFEPPPVK